MTELLVDNVHQAIVGPHLEKDVTIPEPVVLLISTKITFRLAASIIGITSGAVSDSAMRRNVFF